MKILTDAVNNQSKFMQIHSTSYQDTKGNIKEWSWVSRPNNQRAVMIVPMIRGNFIWNGKEYVEDNKLVIIKEFRVPLNDYEYSFPAGLIDGDEMIAECAIRELYEETGYNIQKALHISPFVVNTAGLSNESIAIVFAEVAGDPSNKANESSEEIEIFTVDRLQMKNILNTPTNLFSAKSWLIMKHFVNHGDINLF